MTHGTSTSIQTVLIVAILSFLLNSEISAENINRDVSPGPRINAIENLNFGEKIPDQVYNEYDSKAIGEAIVKWVRHREATRKWQEGEMVAVDLMNESQIMIQMDSSTLPLVRQSGYLNQHESGTSKGALGLADRKTGEDEFTGLQMSDINPTALKVRPKSALLHVSAPIEIGLFPYDLFRYGRMAAVLGDQVKRRTLWAAGDSLAIGWNKPTSRKLEDDLTRRRGSLLEGRLPSKKTVGSGIYIEALIYGEIGFGDIDHFVVYSESQLPPLIEFGKPVFLIKEKTRFGRLYREYRRLLYRGESMPQSLPPGERKKFESELSRR